MEVSFIICGKYLIYHYLPDLGIFISVKTSSQQVAMLISLMGMLLPTILFSGFMFPIENMPKALQIFSNVVPAKWFYIIVKSIMIKGRRLFRHLERDVYSYVVLQFFYY